MLAPHALDIAVIISSLIASLTTFHICRHFENFQRQVKLCKGQRNYKQKSTTHRMTGRIRAR